MPTASTYLSDLDAALVGPARVRRDLVREAANHLEDATDAYRRAGYERGEAEDLAVADFGDLDQVAPAFQTTLAVSAARRTAWLLLAVLSIQPFLWDGPITIGTSGKDPASDNVVYAVLDVGVEVLGGLTMLVALLLALATTIGNRWFHAGRRLARVTSLFTITATGSAAATGLAMAALSGGLAPTFWLMMGAFLLTPMGLAAWSGRRTLATC